MGSFSCGKTSLASSPKKVITPGSNLEVPRGSTCPEPRAYLFLAELVEPPPAKPPEIVLRVCRVELASFTSSTALPFFLDRESEVESRLGDESRLLGRPGSSFTYVDSFPF